jgi:hypothetical protein
MPGCGPRRVSWESEEGQPPSSVGITRMRSLEDPAVDCSKRVDRGSALLAPAEPRLLARVRLNAVPRRDTEREANHNRGGLRLCGV